MRDQELLSIKDQVNTNNKLLHDCFAYKFTPPNTFITLPENDDEITKEWFEATQKQMNTWWKKLIPYVLNKHGIVEYEDTELTTIHNCHELDEFIRREQNKMDTSSGGKMVTPRMIPGIGTGNNEYDTYQLKSGKNKMNKDDLEKTQLPVKKTNPIDDIPKELDAKIEEVLKSYKINKKEMNETLTSIPTSPLTGMLGLLITKYSLMTKDNLVDLLKVKDAEPKKGGKTRKIRRRTIRNKKKGKQTKKKKLSTKTKH